MNAQERTVIRFLKDEARRNARVSRRYKSWMAKIRSGLGPDGRGDSAQSVHGVKLFQDDEFGLLTVPLDGDWVYSGIADLLLKHGRFYEPQPLPRPYRRRRAKQCFDNAFDTAKKWAGGLRYVEGIAFSSDCPGFPIRHGWCVDAQRRVLEVTWPTPGLLYFGVTISLRRIEAIRLKITPTLLATGRHPTSALGDDSDDFPIFREPFTEPQDL